MREFGGTGVGLAAVSAVSFGLSGPFAKALIDAGWSSDGTLLVRLGGASVVLAAVLAVTRPGVVIVWVWLVRRRRPSRLTVLGGGIAVVGLSLVVQVWTGVVLDWRGLAWALSAAVCSAVYFLLADRADSTTPALVLAGVGLAVGTVI